ncbi:hypothetical protein AMAG_03720 [Allomyces macrogynus ATCC 38327]|uniref:Uncharacterized protein n=1 Tax=Allomyces macrogynus (strain ATCC 38327) TaxID=578462 RepID=A0A0L0SAH8_ALLM3|nr:hypothetical protein AMAG_03720 [Allomyces macrogynus ATCC 38327]|eukprot:KNE59442.1 hypothetical protein AMAG_03720 [Allomyces macrogynus ATCC 38327]
MLLEMERLRGRTKSTERSPSSARPKEGERIASRPDSSVRRAASRSPRRRSADNTGIKMDMMIFNEQKSRFRRTVASPRVPTTFSLSTTATRQYDAVNALFLALQAHFPPTSARHVCLTHDRALYAHIVGDVVRFQADITPHVTSRSLASHIRAATYFYLHRVAVAFHQPTMTRPPLVKGDPTAPAAFHHRLSLMHMYGRIVKHLERRNAQTGAEEREERGRSASPSRHTRPSSAQHRAENDERGRGQSPTARARSSGSRPGSSSPTRLLGSRNPSRSPTRGLSLDRHRAQLQPQTPDSIELDPDLPDECAVDAQFDWRLVCHAESVLVDLATWHGMTASVPSKHDRMWPTHSINLAVPLPRLFLALPR